MDVALFAAASVATYVWLPSWRVAAAVVAVSAGVGVAGPDSTAAVVLAPAHLAASAVLLACALRWAGLGEGDARVAAACLLAVLAVAAARHKKSCDDSR